MSGADGNARLAARALVIVEYGQIVHHCDRPVRALHGAHAAAYAANFAARHNFLCLAVGGAGLVTLSILLG